MALDSSGSVRRDGWAKSLQFTRDVVARLKLSPECARVALISIGTYATVYSYLNTDEDSDALDEAIASMRFKDEWTNTGSAFKAMTTEIYKPGRGNRAGVVNVAILLTDGPSNRDAHYTVPNANVSR